jgi:hypothetical protein
MSVGQWLELESDATAVVADIGTMTVRSGSRFRLMATDAEEHRVQLAYGVIKVSVDAPPRLFVVETPSVTAVDLGCEYTLALNEQGDGSLMVTSGHVSMEVPGREVMVPAGAQVAVRAGALSLPFYDADVGDAVTAWENGAPLAHLIQACDRPRDILTLNALLDVVDVTDWHLIANRIAEI